MSKTGIGKFIVFRAAKKEVRDRFFNISGLPFGVHFETRAEKWSWIGTLFLQRVLGARRGATGVVLGVFLGSLWGLLGVSLAPLSNKTLDSAKHPRKTHGQHREKGVRI